MLVQLRMLLSHNNLRSRLHVAFRLLIPSRNPVMADAKCVDWRSIGRRVGECVEH